MYEIKTWAYESLYKYGLGGKITFFENVVPTSEIFEVELLKPDGSKAKLEIPQGLRTAFHSHFFYLTWARPKNKALVLQQNCSGLSAYFGLMPGERVLISRTKAKTFNIARLKERSSDSTPATRDILFEC